MSKIYEALKRLETERAEDRAREQGIPRPGGSWRGLLVGCVLGLGAGLLLSGAISTRQPPAPRPASPAVPPPASPVAAPAVPSPREPLATVAVGIRETPAESSPVAAAHARGAVAIQVGTFRNHENSVRLAARLGAEGYRVTIEPVRTDRRLWVVRVGDYPDRDAAESARAALERLGVSGFLVGASLERTFDDASRHARAQDGR